MDCGPGTRRYAIVQGPLKTGVDSSATHPSAGVEDRPPVEDRVPQHPLIAAVEIAVQRVEVEGDDVALALGHIENGGPPDQVFLPPRLAAHHEGSAFTVAPLEHDATAIDGTVETGGAIRHAQPAPRQRVEREVLAEDPGARRVAVRDRVVGTCKG